MDDDEWILFILPIEFACNNCLIKGERGFSNLMSNVFLAPILYIVLHTENLFGILKMAYDDMNCDHEYKSSKTITVNLKMLR